MTWTSKSNDDSIIQHVDCIADEKEFVGIWAEKEVKDQAKADVFKSSTNAEFLQTN